MGPEKAADAIRKALQMGADKGVHVVDDAIAGSDCAGDLAGAGRRRSRRPALDLVVCGMASTDGGMGVVPAMLAERLGLPQVTFALRRSRSQGDQVRRSVATATPRPRRRGTLPLVLSVTDQSGEARYPSFKGIMAAKKKPVETWTLADLGVDADQVGLSAAWTAVEATEARPPRTAGRDRQRRGRLRRQGARRVPRAKKFI